VEDSSQLKSEEHRVRRPRSESFRLARVPTSVSSQHVHGAGAICRGGIEYVDEIIGSFLPRFCATSLIPAGICIEDSVRSRSHRFSRERFTKASYELLPERCDIENWHSSVTVYFVALERLEADNAQGSLSSAETAEQAGRTIR
jgi:hypothetical protein